MGDSGSWVVGSRFAGLGLSGFWGLGRYSGESVFALSGLLNFKVPRSSYTTTGARTALFDSRIYV